MKSTLTLAFLCTQTFLFSQNPSKLIQIGGIQDDLSYGLCKGSGNHFFTSGYFSGSVSMGNTTLLSSGNNDIFISKHDSAGQVVWAKKAGGANSDMGFSVSYNNGYAYVTGVFSGSATFGSTTLTSSGQEDGFIAKYDDNGNLIWAKKAGASLGSDRTDQIVFEGGGIMYMCASYMSGATYNGVSLLNNGGLDAYIIKLDTAGNLLNYTNIGGGGNDYTFDLKWYNNNLYIAGMYASNQISFDNISKSNNGSYDSYLAKYDTALNVVWANAGGGSGYDNFEKLIVDSIGNCYVTGQFNGQATYNTTVINSTIQSKTDGCVVKYTSTGSLGWVKKVGALESGVGREITFGDWQNEIVTYGHFSLQIDNNSFSDTSNGLSDGFVLKLDENGNTTSLYTFGGSGNEIISESVKLGNRIWVSGGLSGTSLFDTISVLSNGGTDVGLWQFMAAPTINIGLKQVSSDRVILNLYPNPTTGIIQLNATQNIQSVQVFDQLGKLLLTKTDNAKNITIELGLPVGVYIIRAKTGTEILQQKLLVQ
jgi:hypothetical protein